MANFAIGWIVGFVMGGGLLALVLLPFRNDADEEQVQR